MSSRTFRLERAVLFQKRHHMATGNWLSSAHRRRRQIPKAFPWNLRDLHSVSFPTIPDSDILSDGALWFTSALPFPSVPPFSLTWCARADATTTGVMALLTRPRTLVISPHQPTRTRQDSKHFSTYLYFYLRVFKSSSMYIGLVAGSRARILVLFGQEWSFESSGGKFSFFSAREVLLQPLAYISSNISYNQWKPIVCTES